MDAVPNLIVEYINKGFFMQCVMRIIHSGHHVALSADAELRSAGCLMRRAALRRGSVLNELFALSRYRTPSADVGVVRAMRRALWRRAIFLIKESRHMVPLSDCACTRVIK